MTALLTLPEAEALAERILTAIDRKHEGPLLRTLATDGYCRERVVSDLAGLRQHAERRDGYMLSDEHGLCRAYNLHAPWPCPDACRYSDGLRRTAALYGVPYEAHAADRENLPLHRTEANYGVRCSTCDGGGCLDCTDPA